MTLFQRAHDIVAAKANKALDAAEKPDEMLDLSYEQLLDQLTQVRRGLVDIAAARKQIELQAQQLQHTVSHLQDQAKAALAQGNEELAREALSRKAAAQAQIDALEPQHQQLTDQEQKLEQTLAALQHKVNEFRTQKEVLKAQYTAAQATSSVDESVTGWLFVSTGAILTFRATADTPTAPFKSGTTVGTVTGLLNTRTVVTWKVVSAGEVAAPSPWWKLFSG